MAAKTIAEKLAAKIDAREKLGDEIAALKIAVGKQKKAEKQKQERKLGRLALAAGLDQFSESDLKDAFEKLENELQEKLQNGRHPSDALASEDEQVKSLALSET